MADNGGKKGISCSGMLGAFGFLVILFILVRVFAGFNAAKNTETSSTPAATSATTAVTPIVSFEKTTATEEAIETEEVNYVWANYDLGLAMSKETASTNDGTYIHIYGYLSNASKKNYSYAAIYFTLRDKNGVKVGDAMANTSGLKSGDIWKFDAFGIASGASKFELDGAEAW